MNNEVIWEDIHNVLRGHLSGGGVTVYSEMTTGPLEKTILDLAESRLAAGAGSGAATSWGIILENLSAGPM